MKTSIFILFFVLIAAFNYAYSQCSDAGICIIGKKHKNEEKKNLSSISLGYQFGTSGNEPNLEVPSSSLSFPSNKLLFNSVVLDADMFVSSNSRLSLSIPFTIIKGTDYTNNGIGDLLILYNHTFVIKKKHNLTISIGGRATLGNVNTTDSLPQWYMPGLGTNDLILGATYSIAGYSVSAAYQKPFGRSANFRTRLQRGDDFLFRAGYYQPIGKVNIKAEILTIIRIQKSSVLASADSTGETFMDVPNSNEPQVNLLVTVGYNINDRFSLSVNGALPFLKRDYNLDGLKRSFTAGIALSYLFEL